MLRSLRSLRMQLNRGPMGGILLVEAHGVILRAWRGLSDDLLAQVRFFPRDPLPEWMQTVQLVSERLSEPGVTPDFIKQEGVQTWAALPLKARRDGGEEALIGTLMLGSRRYQALAQEDLSTLQAISEQLALAIAQARLHRDARERLARLQVLREIDRAIIGQHSIQDILDIVLTHIPEGLGAEAVAVSLLNGDRQHAQVFHMRLPNGTVVHEPAFDLAEGLLHWLVERQEPVVIYDLAQDPRVQMYREHIRQQRLVSYLGVPLVAQGQTIGLLHILTTRPRVFADEDVAFFRTLAGQAAIAIANVRLLEDVKAAEEKYRRLAENAPDIIYHLRLAPEPCCEYINPAVTAITGYTPEEFYADPDLARKIVHPEDRGLLEAAFQGKMEPGKPLTLRWQRKDGVVSWSEQRVVPLFDAAGNLVAVEGISRDITERKWAEAQLTGQLQTLAALYVGAQKLAESLDLEAVAREISRTCVEVLNVQLAWLGRAEADGRVTLLSHFPADHPYPREITVRWDDTPLAQGPTGRAIRRGFPEVVGDVSADPRFVSWRPIAEKYGFRSSAAFPLISRGRTFGALNLYSDQPGFFTPELLDTFQALANQAAAALENVRLYQETLRRAQQLQVLSDIDRVVIAGMSPRASIGTLFDALVQGVVSSTQVDAAALLLLDPSDSTLEYTAGYGFRGTAVQETRLRLGEGYAGRAALERRVFGVNDIGREGGFKRFRLLEEEGFVAYHAVPLIARDRVLGVLETFSRRPLPANGEWLAFLEALASQVSLGLDNIYMYRELQGYAAELESRVAQRTAELSAANEELRRAHEEVSRALAHERELNELKTRFISIVSHEFRTPLTTILSSAELLEYYGARWPEDKKLLHLRRIAETVQRMTALLDDVLIISRTEAGRLAYQPQPLDLVPWCRNLVEEFQLGMGAGHRLVLEWAGPGEPERVPAVMDGQLLHHILSNLLSNAIKYSPAGSEVRLAVEPAGEQVVFRVEDHGIGIPAADLPHLFEPFHRASNVSHISGTGLGLNIVKRMVDLCGGRISVASEEGRGSTFTVELPLYRELQLA